MKYVMAIAALLGVAACDAPAQRRQATPAPAGPSSAAQDASAMKPGVLAAPMPLMGTRPSTGRDNLGKSKKGG